MPSERHGHIFSWPSTKALSVEITCIGKGHVTHMRAKVTMFSEENRTTSQDYRTPWPFWQMMRLSLISLGPCSEAPLLSVCSAARITTWIHPLHCCPPWRPRFLLSEIARLVCILRLAWWIKFDLGNPASIERILSLNNDIPEITTSYHDPTTNGTASQSATILNENGDPVWKVLVFDNLGRDIISSVLRVNDLRSKGVTIHLWVHATTSMDSRSLHSK